MLVWKLIFLYFCATLGSGDEPGLCYKCMRKTVVVPVVHHHGEHTPDLQFFSKGGISAYGDRCYEYLHIQRFHYVKIKLNSNTTGWVPQKDTFEMCLPKFFQANPSAQRTRPTTTDISTVPTISSTARTIIRKGSSSRLPLTSTTTISSTMKAVRHRSTNTKHSDFTTTSKPPTTGKLCTDSFPNCDAYGKNVICLHYPEVAKASCQKSCSLCT